MLKDLVIKNYKGFKDETTIEFRPLTLVFGENNAGKSSIVRILPSIKKTCYQKKQGVAFYPVEIYKTLPSTEFFNNINRPFELKFNFNDINFKYEIFIVDNELKIISLGINDNEIINFDSASNTYKIGLDIIDIELKNLLIDKIENLIEDNLKSTLSSINEKIISLISKIYWIGPIRHIPQPIEKLALAQSKMSPDGMEATQILAASFFDDQKVFNTVREWFIKIFKQQIILKETGLGRHKMFAIGLSPVENTEPMVSIADCGTGISQILPILVLLAQAKEGKLGMNPFLIFENPDLHLQDVIHAELGLIFSQISQCQYKPYIIIETHSENLLLSMQLAVAKEELSNKDISIYWAKKIGDSNILDPITINENAVLSENWSLDAFRTNVHISRQIFNVLRAK